METYLELLKLIPKNDVFNTDCSFSSPTKAAVINRSGSTANLHQFQKPHIDSFPVHGFQQNNPM